MTEAYLRDGILGALVTAGLGDALGAATEQWATAEIYAAYGGPLREILDPPPDTFSGAAGNTKGQITDDASQMYYLAEDIIAADGLLNEDVWRGCLLRWAAESPHIANMGPSTRPVVEAMQAGEDPYLVGSIGKTSRPVASMGATMALPCGSRQRASFIQATWKKLVKLRPAPAFLHTVPVPELLLHVP